MTQQQSFFGDEPPIDNRNKLQQKFIIPPFSVLDTKQGYWQERKNFWLSLGIESEIGRGENLLGMSEAVKLRTKRNDSLLFKSLSGGTPNYYTQKEKIEKEIGRKLSNTEFEDDYLEVNGVVATGTSIFNPVLCELIYRWFCPDNGSVLDPFAGGSARGIVANLLGYDYYGIDLSQQQVKANIEQGKRITPQNPPHWVVGSAQNMDNLIPNKHFSFILTCPPYHDLEKYSDDMDDLSNMSWSTFKTEYAKIIEKCVAKLENNRFACFVVSEIRNENGSFKGLVPLTITCFMASGMWYYNEIILLNTVGSLALRIGGQFSRFRKIGRMHQNVLVFYKGDMERIPYHFKEIDDSLPSFSST